MNCKQGDLAIVVKSMNGHEGKIVKCMRFVGKVHGWQCDDRWEIDQHLQGFLGGWTNTASDSCLRPIRDPGNDATDETLEWLSVPKKQVSA